MGYFGGMARSYRQKCPVARTLDVIGERWTALILRDLLRDGPRRYQDFQESLAGIAPNTLSARLKALEAAGLIERKIYSEHPPRLEYHLTEKGDSLGPVLKALRAWGQQHA
jgi:DNA-binding HxlR family transcriptional regulator